MKLIIWLGILILSVVGWLFLPDAVWRYIFYLRVPLLTGALLAFLPSLSLTLLRAMLRNLFVLRGKWQMAFVILSAIMAGTAVTLAANIILRNAPARFEVPLWILFPGFWQYVVALMLGLPLAVTAYCLARDQQTASKHPSGRLRGNPFLWLIGLAVAAGAAWIVLPDLKPYVSTVALSLPVCIVATVLSKERLDISARIERESLHSRNRWTGVLLGVTMAVIFLLLMGWLDQWLQVHDEVNRFFVRLISLLTKQSPQGYIDAGKLAPGHSTALAFLSVGLLLYGWLAWKFQPQPVTNRSEAPALLYVTALIAIASLFLSGLTFFFDFYEILALLLVLVGSAGIYALFQVDHFFVLKPTLDPVQPDSLTDFAAVLHRRLDHQPVKTLVLVCASGGGIQAAGWTVEVLAGLQDLLGPEFTRATGMISSASGGSVGTMYFLDRFNAKTGYPDPTVLNQIFDSATRDSLDAVGWGLTYPDLTRLVGLPFLVNPLCDRGTAVETDWQGELTQPGLSLDHWRKQVLDGAIPIPVFNATLVEDGRRFLISPMTFVQLKAGQSVDDAITKHRFIDFNTLFGPSYDISAVTAARLSATFPYVSPICRCNLNLKGRTYHMADGGYFDNTGVFTVVEWLDQLLKSGQISDIKRIMVLQINAFPRSLPGAQTKGDDVSQGGWVMSVLGPLLALFRVRDSTQTARNQTELDLLCQRWKTQGVEICHFPIFFPSFEAMQRMESQFDPRLQRPYFFNRDGKYDPPLSWKLTNAEKKAIQRAWRQIACDPHGEVKPLYDCWQRWGMNPVMTLNQYCQ